MSRALASQFTASGSPANRRKSGTPAFPPIPKDQGRCRWCSGKRLEIEDGWWYCQHGCADSDSTPYRRTCPECRRDFLTGNPTAEQCHPCESSEVAEVVAAEGSQAEWAANGEVERESFDRASAGDDAERMRRRTRQHVRWNHARVSSGKGI